MLTFYFYKKTQRLFLDTRKVYEALKEKECNTHHSCESKFTPACSNLYEVNTILQQKKKERNQSGTNQIEDDETLKPLSTTGP